MRRPALPQGPYLVVGLARSGAAIALALREHGEVIGVDAGEPAEAAGLEGVEVHLAHDGVDLLERARTVVKSPGVPNEAAVVEAAHGRGVVVTGELELAWRLIPNRFVAVTGTNGKTTTTELLGEIWRAAGLPVAVAGNVGTPLASLAGAERGRALGPEATIVCEASSFQLEDSSAFAPECALLLNLAEDHLDRHGTLDAYREAKLSVFANQRPEDVAVVPSALDPRAERGIALQGQGRVVAFGDESAELALREGALWWEGVRLIATSDLRLRGAHNVENAAAAAAAALASGIAAEAVVEALTTFAGVPHRLEEVAERDGVLYVNDSKATNVASARVALEAFEGGVHAILGGSLKGGGFAGLRASAAARCRACYLIGEAAERIEADLGDAIPTLRCGDLETAFEAARADARPGEVVLLSPACASFDQFEDYEARGDRFRALVEGL